ncbi:MAG TPA: zinc-dependent metalloprotease, partial [Fimbriimonadaceae bacterium]|nr:zinc-dependent metalloprotease [Fimbriimonadaceae bacterium]
NALVVKDAPENDPNWDHADGTHNVIRWNMSEDAAYAVSWFRVDPLSGQVLNAAVSIDANYAAVMLQQYNLLLEQASSVQSELSKEALLRPQQGQYNAAQMLVNGLDPTTEAKRDKFEKLGWNRTRCDYAERLAESTALDWLILSSKGAKITQDDFMHQFIADLVMHEVGHCLGLRHNFAGSTQWSVKDLLDDAKINELGLSASVMDYTPLNTPAVLRGNGVFFNSTVGPYDMWAIQYGYSEFPKGQETSGLAAIARESGEPGHLFLTDEDADGINPLAVRYDLSSDTIDWLKTEGEGNQSVRNYAINGVTKVGQDYSLRNSLILRSFIRDARNSLMASRFVGGVEMRRMFKGDVGEKPTLAPVDPQVQRQAMKLIIDKTLMQTGVDLPQTVKVGLSMDPNDGIGAIWNAPLRAIIGGNQIAVLATLMSATKADDIAENSFKMAGSKDRYTLTEHYNMLFASVFKEVGRNEDISALRRDLQRFMVEGLITQASAPNGLINDDVRVIAAAGLARLKVRFDKQIATPKGLDEITILHLKDISAQIGRFQKRTMVGGR